MATKSIIASVFSPASGPSIAGMSPTAVALLESGNREALLRCLWHLCHAWLEAGGFGVSERNFISSSKLMGVSADCRATVAAGCDLYDLLWSTPQGRQALLDLGQKPGFDDLK